MNRCVRYQFHVSVGWIIDDLVQVIVLQVDFMILTLILTWYSYVEIGIVNIDDAQLKRILCETNCIGL